MTLSEIIYQKGLRKEFVIKQSGIARNRFYCNIKSPHKFTPDELERIAIVVGVDKKIIFDVTLK